MIDEDEAHRARRPCSCRGRTRSSRGCTCGRPREPARARRCGSNTAKIGCSGPPTRSTRLAALRRRSDSASPADRTRHVCPSGIVATTSPVPGSPSRSSTSPASASSRTESRPCTSPIRRRSGRWSIGRDRASPSSSAGRIRAGPHPSLREPVRAPLRHPEPVPEPRAEERELVVPALGVRGRRRERGEHEHDDGDRALFACCVHRDGHRRGARILPHRSGAAGLYAEPDAEPAV